MYPVFEDKFVLCQGDRVEKYANRRRNVFGVHHFLMEANRIVAVLKDLEFRCKPVFLLVCALMLLSIRL